MKKMIGAVLGVILSAAGVARAEEKVLDLFAWSEYVPTAVIEGFEKETGIKVNYTDYDSNETMLGKLLGGGSNYDLIQPSTYVIEALVKAKKLEPLDHAKLSNLKNIDPAFLNLAHDPGNKYSVPWMAGTVGIVVNTEKVKDDIKGYKDVFQEKHKGRIVALDDGREWVAWVLNAQGKDVNDITPEVLEQVRPTLAQWMKLVKVYDSDSPKTALTGGDVDLGLVWSGEGAILWREDKEKFKWVLPAEGVDQFVDSLAIPAGAKHPEAAHAFINYILRPEVSKLISEEFPYTNPNAEARKLLSEEDLANPASYPKPPLPPMRNFTDIGAAAADIDALFTDLKSAQ
ncbi:MAG TPA: spermidine/putrescine ABC transporter substrate-binding protein [Tepidisphaeraceae bacterium]|nr:spermidine/putrescine ABC transporter substrate-binding protein [Tepidisphaeraceae bacterium]